MFSTQTPSQGPEEPQFGREASVGLDARFSVGRILIAIRRSVSPTHVAVLMVAQVGAKFVAFVNATVSAIYLPRWVLFTEFGTMGWR